MALADWTVTGVFLINRVQFISEPCSVSSLYTEFLLNKQVTMPIGFDFYTLVTEDSSMFFGLENAGKLVELKKDGDYLYFKALQGAGTNQVTIDQSEVVPQPEGDEESEGDFLHLRAWVFNLGFYRPRGPGDWYYSEKIDLAFQFEQYKFSVNVWRRLNKNIIIVENAGIKSPDKPKIWGGLFTIDDFIVMQKHI